MCVLFKTLINILTNPVLSQYEGGKLNQLKACVKEPTFKEEKIHLYAFNYVRVIC